MGQLVNIQNRAGQTIRLGGAKFIPVEKVVQMQPPGMGGFFSWRRPSLVLVEQPDGTEEIIKIQDPTRQAQIAFLLIGIVGSILIWIINQLSSE